MDVQTSFGLAETVTGLCEKGPLARLVKDQNAETHRVESDLTGQGDAGEASLSVSLSVCLFWIPVKMVLRRERETTWLTVAFEHVPLSHWAN